MSTVQAEYAPGGLLDRVQFPITTAKTSGSVSVIPRTDTALGKR